MSDLTANQLSELIFARRDPRPAVSGPQPATVVSTNGSTCFVTVAALANSGLAPGFKYGPAPIPAGMHVNVGDSVLVVFAGPGVGQPWVVAGATVSPLTAAQVAHAADLSSSSTQAFTGPVTAPTLDPTLAGGTGRLVGFTAAGAPTSGAWSAGDVAIDNAGAVWCCYQAGSPGLWSYPIGYLLGHNYGPTTATNFVSLAPAVGVTCAVVAGHSYKLEGRILGTQSSSAAGLVEALLTTADGLVSERFISTSVGASVEYSGGGATIWTPASTGTVVADLQVFDSAGYFGVGANAAELIVTRVA